jgi:hypothetical protein
MPRSNLLTRLRSFSLTFSAAVTSQSGRYLNFSRKDKTKMEAKNQQTATATVAPAATEEAPSTSQDSQTKSSATLSANTQARPLVMPLNEGTLSGLELAVQTGVPQDRNEFWYLVSRNWTNILFCDSQCSGGSTTNDRMRYLLGLKNNQDPAMADEIATLYEAAAAIEGSSGWPGFDHLKGLAENGQKAVQVEGEQNSLTGVYKHYAEKYSVTVTPTTVENLYGKTGREGEQPTDDERAGVVRERLDGDQEQSGGGEQRLYTGARLHTPGKQGDPR